MKSSLLFRVRPDGENARWTNVARLMGLAGALLMVVAKLLPAGMSTFSSILLVPAALLGLGNLVWIYLLPSLVMLALYTVAFSVISLVNLLHIVILQRNNDELVYFLAKFMNMRTRFALSVLGLTHRVPHVDVYGSDMDNEVLDLRFRTEMELPVRWVLLRLALLAGVTMILFLFSLVLRYVPYATMVLGGVGGIIVGALVLSVLVIWIHNAITGGYIEPLIDLHLRLLRVGLVVGAYFGFVTNDIREFQVCFRSVLDEDIPVALPETDWINPNDARRLDINLIALVVLIGSSLGLYLFVWLARVGKVMGDDPFTLISVSLLGFMLPLSVILSRYYRRLEKKTGNDPSLVLELLMVLPVVNLLVATFTIQSILNLSKKARPA